MNYPKSLTTYLNTIIQKFSFVKGIYITDEIGAEVVSYMRNNEEEVKGESPENQVLLRLAVNKIFVNGDEQIKKLGKESLKQLCFIYDEEIIFIEKINDSLILLLFADQSYNF